MKIREIRLDGFGKFKRLILTFPADFTFVHGTTEAGKTTLVDAVTAVLFGLKRAQKRLRERYRPWEEPETFRASLIITDEQNRQYLMGRDFNHDRLEVFRSQGVRLEPISDAEWDGIRRPEFGLEAPELFEETSLIRQLELNLPWRSQAAGGSLLASIGRLLVGGLASVGAAQPLEALRSDLAKLAAGENPLSIPALSAQVSASEHDLALAMEAANKLRVLSEHKKRLQQQLSELTTLSAKSSGQVSPIGPTEAAAITAVSPAVADTEASIPAKTTGDSASITREQEITARIEVLQSEQRARSEENRLRQAEIEHLMSEIAATKSRMSDLDEQLLKQEIQDKLAALFPAINENSGRLSELFPQLDLLLEKLRRYKRWRNFVCILDLIAAAGASIAWRFFLRSYVYALAGAAGLFIVYSLALLIRAGRLRKKIKKLNEEISRREKELKQSKTETETLLQGKTYSQFQAELQSYQLCLKDLWDFEHSLAEKQAGFQQDDNGSLSWDLARLRGELAAIQSDLQQGKTEVPPAVENNAGLAAPHTDPPVSAALPSPERPAETEADMAEELRRHLRDMDGEIREIISANALDLTAAEQDLAEAMRKLSWAQRRQRSIQLALTELEAAMDAAGSGLGPDLGKAAGEILSKITAGRYQKVYADMSESGLDLRVGGADGRPPVDAANLSAGATEQLYLSLRLALLAHNRDSHQPLLFDDPFAGLDRQRLIDTIRLLAGISHEHQVIWFTKDRTLIDLAIESIDSDLGVVTIA